MQVLDPINANHFQFLPKHQSFAAGAAQTGFDPRVNDIRKSSFRRKTESNNVEESSSEETEQDEKVGGNAKNSLNSAS